MLAESEAVTEYLEEAHPEPALLPRDLARYHDNRLEPPLRALLGQMDPAARDADVIEAGLGEYADQLGALAGRKADGP